VAVATKTFLPGIGFRRPGTRLAEPVSVQQGERTLTVLRLIATPESTDLIYEVTHLPNDGASMPMPRGARAGMDRVWLSAGSGKYGPGGGMSISVRPGKLVRTFTLVPVPEGTTRIDLHVDGADIGEWNVPLELVPFPGDDEARYVEIGASDARHGVTVTVRGMVHGAAFTAFDLFALADSPEIRIWGLGGLHMRDATTALVLRDDKGHSFTERFRQDARDQFPDPSGIADVAIFEGLPDDAEHLTIEVPSVCFDDRRPQLEIDLPVQAPIDARLGDYPIRISGGSPETVTRGGRSVAVVALAVELGRVDDEFCVIHPTMAKADGQISGVGWGSDGIYAPSPEPVKTVEVYYQGEAPPQRITLSGATVRARGPWRIGFARPARP
jgi:hypothetical protein